MSIAILVVPCNKLTSSYKLIHISAKSRKIRIFREDIERKFHEKLGKENGDIW